MIEIVTGATIADSPTFSMSRFTEDTVHEFSLEFEPDCTGTRSVVRNYTRRPIVVRWDNGIDVTIEPANRKRGWEFRERERIDIGIEFTGRSGEHSNKYRCNINTANQIDVAFDKKLQALHNELRYGVVGNDTIAPKSYPCIRRGDECQNTNYRIILDVYFEQFHPNEKLRSDLLGCTIYTDAQHPDICMSEGNAETGLNKAYNELNDDFDLTDARVSDPVLLTNAFIIDRHNKMRDYFTWIHGEYHALPRRNNHMGKDGLYVQIITNKSTGKVTKYFTVEECAEKAGDLNALGIYSERNAVFEHRNSKEIQSLNKELDAHKNEIEKLKKALAAANGELAKRNDEVKDLKDALADKERKHDRQVDDLRDVIKSKDQVIDSLNNTQKVMVSELKFKYETEISKLKDDLAHTNQKAEITVLGLRDEIRQVKNEAKNNLAKAEQEHVTKITDLLRTTSNKTQTMQNEINSLQHQLKYAKDSMKSSKLGDLFKNFSIAVSAFLGIYRMIR